MGSEKPPNLFTFILQQPYTATDSRSLARTVWEFDKVSHSFGLIHDCTRPTLVRSPTSRLVLFQNSYKLV